MLISWLLLSQPKGVRVLVTVLPNEEAEFWLKASQTSLDAVWDNADDGFSSMRNEPGSNLSFWQLGR
jgi:hypothetical protein